MANFSADLNININTQSAVQANERLIKTLDRLDMTMDKSSKATKNLEKATKQQANATQALQKASVLIQGPLGGVAARITTLNSVIQTGNKQIVGYTLALTALAATFTEAFQRAEALRGSLSQLKVLTGDLEEAVKAQEALFRISNNVGQRVGDVTQTFARYSIALREAGVSTNTLLALTDTTQKLLAAQGGATQSAKDALFQFTQGLAAGTLRGQELNSVLEQTPIIAQTVAKGIGATTGELRRLAEQGKLTRKEVLAALLNLADETDGLFESRIQGIDESLARLDNRLTQILGDTSLGAVTRAAGKFFVDFAADALAGFAEITEAVKILGKTVVEVFSLAFRTVVNLVKLIPQSFNVVGEQIADLILSPIRSVVNALGAGNTSIGRTINDITERNLASLRDSTLQVDATLRQIGEDATAAGVAITNAFKEGNAEIDKIREGAAQSPFNLEEAEEEINKLPETAGKASREITRVFNRAADNIQDAFADAFQSIFDEGRLDFKSFFSDLGRAVTTSVSQYAATAITSPLTQAIRPGGAGLGAGISGSISNIGNLFGLQSPTADGGSGAFNFTGLGSLLSASGFTSNPAAVAGVTDVARSLGFFGDISGIQGAAGTLGSLAGAAGGFAGNLGADLLFGSDRGIGASIGGTLGAIGGSFFGPVGTGVGAFLGNAVGGLFGNNKPSSKLQLGFTDLGAGSTGTPFAREGLTGKKFSQENFDTVTRISELASALSNAFGGIEDDLRVDVSNRTGVGFGFGQGEGLRDTSILQFFRDETEFTDALVTQIAQKANASRDVLTAIDNIDFSDLQQAISDVNFALQFDQGFEFLEDNTTALERAIEQLDLAFTEAVNTAERLGLAEDKIVQARDNQLDQYREAINNDVQNAILQIVDPRSYNLQQLERSFVELRRNAVVTGADLVEVERLYSLQREEVLRSSLEEQQETLRESYTDIIRDIQRLRDGILLDPELGGLSSLGRADEAQNIFNRLRGRISSGDLTAIEDLDAVTDDLLQASLDYYGPTEQYLARLEDVFQLLDDAETLAANTLTTEENILLQNELQSELLQQLVDSSTNVSSLIPQLGNVSLGSILRPGETAADLERINQLNNLSEELVRELKVVASGGSFNFSTAQGSFADFVRAGNQQAGSNFLDLLQAFGGQNIGEQANRFGLSEDYRSQSAKETEAIVNSVDQVAAQVAALVEQQSINANPT